MTRRSVRPGSTRVAVSCSGCGIPLVLRLHADSKTAPVGVWDRGARATFAQAFPLPAGPVDRGGSCSGFSDGIAHDGDPEGTCSGCYAAGLERYPGFAAMAASNLRAVRHVLGCCGARGLGLVFADMLRSVAAEWERDGIPGPVSFRWQSDGDVLNAAHARAIVSAHRIVRAEGVDLVGWIYTRTTGAVRILATGERHGLRVLASVDRVNVDRMGPIARRHRVPVAVLARDPGEAARLCARVGAGAMLPDHERAASGVRAYSVRPGDAIPAARICPAAGGRWSHDGRGPAHVVGADGRRGSLVKGGAIRGACDACRLCLPGGLRSSVVFIHHGNGATVRDGVPVSIGARS